MSRQDKHFFRSRLTLPADQYPLRYRFPVDADLKYACLTFELRCKPVSTFQSSPVDSLKNGSLLESGSLKRFSVGIGLYLP